MKVMIFSNRPFLSRRDLRLLDKISMSEIVLDDYPNLVAREYAIKRKIKTTMFRSDHAQYGITASRVRDQSIVSMLDCIIVLPGGQPRAGLGGVPVYHPVS